MSLAVCTCLCGGSTSLVRNFLHSAGYPDWMNIPIHQGKEKSLALLNQLPPAPEKDMLQDLLRNSSKWAIIIGYDGQNCKWSDISRGGEKTRIEAEFVVDTFSTT